MKFASWMISLQPKMGPNKFGKCILTLLQKVWAAQILLNFSDGRDQKGRSLFFAFEGKPPVAPRLQLGCLGRRAVHPACETCCRETVVRQTLETKQQPWPTFPSNLSVEHNLETGFSVHKGNPNGLTCFGR